jgi:phage terminase large subunit
MYSGMFYDRYILGLWAVAEGLIYDMFTEKNIFTPETFTNEMQKASMRTFVLDYGTANPFHALEAYDDGERCWITREYRYDGRVERRQKTDFEYADDMLAFIGSDFAEFVVDPSALSFKTELAGRGMLVRDADNSVADGIRAVATLFAKSQLMISDECTELIGELRTYRWADKVDMKGKEVPLKEFDHGPDALRYFVKTKLPDWRIGF